MKAMMYKILGWFLRGMVRLIGHLVYRIKARGGGNIPSQGGALLVANHASYMDFVIVLSSVNRHVSFVMNADIYHKPALKWLLKGLRCIPISPRGGKNNFDSFNQAVSEQVNAGNVVVIFAEGTVTRTGQLLEFKKGVEHLSGMINGPIIPIHFHNVQGSPFTFRAGKPRAEKFRIKNLRREVLVNIGKPLQGKTQAFSLRQRMKELEVENFDLMLQRSKTLDDLLRSQLNINTRGSWRCGNKELFFNELNQRLAELDSALLPLLRDEERIGLLLPKDENTYLLNLWLLLHRKTVVNINPDFTNEERFFVVNRAKISTLITTIDLEFTRFSPNAEKIIYTEHIAEAIENGRGVHVVCKRLESFGKRVTSAFRKTTNPDQVVTILFERQKKSDELKCISLSHRQIMSVILGLRQIYYFAEETCMMSDLPIHHAYGYVLEFLQPLLYELHVDIIQDQITAGDFIARLIEKKPSLVIATPSQVRSVAELSQMRNIPFLTHMFTADLHPESHDIRLLNERGIEVYVCAGMNETASVFAVNLSNYQGRDIAGKMMEQENEELGTIGKPLPGVAIKVCDEQMKELVNDMPGKIWIKSSSISTIMGSENCHPVLQEGWFDTGLQGSINHKGFVRIHS